MNNELCFKFENISLYLKQVLIDYMDIPIFFLCSAEKQYYLALCTDMDDLSYIVVKLSLMDVYNLLHGIIPMRDIILKQNEYWNIISGDEISSDIVEKHSIGTINTELLPEENACFEILTKQMQLFVQEFDREIFSSEYFFENNQITEINESAINLPFDLILNQIEQFTELVDYKYKKTKFQNESLFYNEEMKSIETNEATFENMENTKHLNIVDLFRIKESHTNNIIIAA